MAFHGTQEERIAWWKRTCQEDTMIFGCIEPVKKIQDRPFPVLTKPKQKKKRDDEPTKKSPQKTPLEFCFVLFCFVFRIVVNSLSRADTTTTTTTM